MSALYAGVFIWLWAHSNVLTYDLAKVHVVKVLTSDHWVATIGTSGSGRVKRQGRPGWKRQTSVSSSSCLRMTLEVEKTGTFDMLSKHFKSDLEF